jgi:hypothetical protein
MHVIDAGAKGEPHGHVSVCRCTGGFGIPNLHRFGWCYWPKASSLNRVLDGTIPSGDTVVKQSLLDRLDALARAVNSRLACKEF